MHELIGTEVSLYTGKVRAYLRYKGIPFFETLSTGDVYREKIIPRTGVRFIPVVITDDDVALQDSTEIIDAFEQRYPEPSVYPVGPWQHLAALLLELYGDEWLVLPAMHYRWNYEENRSFAISEFGRTSLPDRPRADQVEIGAALAAPFAGALPRLGITAETQRAVESSYLSLLTDLDRHFAEHPFLLGARPSIGDFGLIGPLYAHLYRDPYSGRLMRTHAPHVYRWVTRMIDPSAEPGTFIRDDLVPGTLMPVLDRMFREQVPVILATMDALCAWERSHPGAPIPRSVGRVPFEIEKRAGTCAADPYRQWMWQRAVDYYAALSPTDRESVRARLTELPGACDALERKIERRVARRANRLVFASE